MLKHYFLWKEASNSVMIKNAFKRHYPWPLSYLLFAKEYYFNKNRLETANAWNKESKQVLASFIEVIDAFDKKLKSGKLYLLDNQYEIDLTDFLY